MGLNPLRHKWGNRGSGTAGVSPRLSQAGMETEPMSSHACLVGKAGGMRVCGCVCGEGATGPWPEVSPQDIWFQRHFSHQPEMPLFGSMPWLDASHGISCPPWPLSPYVVRHVLSHGVPRDAVWESLGDPCIKSSRTERASRGRRSLAQQRGPGLWVVAMFLSLTVLLPSCSAPAGPLLHLSFPTCKMG